MRSCEDKEWPQCSTTETAQLIWFSIFRVYETFRVFLIYV